MLNEITWGQYLAGTATTLLLYYAGVGLIFYRRELTNFFLSQKAKGQQQGRLLPVSKELQQLLIETDSILNGAGKNASKNEVLTKLRQRLARFTGLRSPAEKDAVLTHVRNQAAFLCEIYISREELADLLQPVEGETAGA